MKTLAGAMLGQTFRELSDSASNEVLIVSPYIGHWSAVRSLLGATWWTKSLLKLRVITDTSIATNVDKFTLHKLSQRGLVKTLPGVHAKIYVFDKRAIVASANLTEAAFTKRREVGVLLDEIESREIIAIFEDWWNNHCDDIDEKRTATQKGSESLNGDMETSGQGLPTLWGLPNIPSENAFNVAETKHRAFSKFQKFLFRYDRLASQYSLVPRLWPNLPLYMEIDALLNYLFHEAPEKPSRQYYDTNNKRALSKEEHLAEVVKWANEFAKWAGDGHDNAEWRVKRLKMIQDYLNPKSIDDLNSTKVFEIANCINAMSAYPINKSRFTNPQNNSIKAIAQAWKDLLHSHDHEEERIERCNASLRYFGTSSIQELLGWYFPDKYPLMNGNSDAGLRYLGY